MPSTRARGAMTSTLPSGIDDSRSARRPRGRAFLLVGLALLGATAIAFAGATASSERTDLVAQGLEVKGERAYLTYVLPPGTDVLASGRLEGVARFPTGVGDVLVLGCADREDLLAGKPLRAGATVLRSVREGMFHVDAGPLRHESAPGCTSVVHVVLAWDADNGWRASPPSAVVELVQRPWLDGPLPGVLIGGVVAGSGLVTAGITTRRRS